MHDILANFSNIVIIMILVSDEDGFVKTVTEMQ